jgi:hypothetical protein
MQDFLVCSPAIVLQVVGRIKESVETHKRAHRSKINSG